MINKLKISIFLLFFATTANSYGQALTATASAEVLAALTINTAPGNDVIDFGVLPTTTPGEVRLDPNSFDNNISVNPVTAKVAQFDVSGQAGAKINVTYDATVDLVAGANQMTMTSIVVGNGAVAEKENAVVVPQNGEVTLSNPEGEFYIWVGGTLPRLDNQAAGEYEGTFNISVAYN